MDNLTEHDRNWWSGLDLLWQLELTKNLLKTPSYAKSGVSADQILKKVKESDELLGDILNLERVDISAKLVYDLTPLLYLRNLNDYRNELKVLPRYWQKEWFILMYPKQLRDKVRFLSLTGLSLVDLSELQDFINLETLECQSCGIEFLNGIEKLKNLKCLLVDQGNNFTDLDPLRGTRLEKLNIQFSKVTDISPLTEVPNLKELDISYTEIKNLMPLTKLPNLEVLLFENERELEGVTLKNFMTWLSGGEKEPRLAFYYSPDYDPDLLLFEKGKVLNTSIFPENIMTFSFDHVSFDKFVRIPDREINAISVFDSGNLANLILPRYLGSLRVHNCKISASFLRPLSEIRKISVSHCQLSPYLSFDGLSMSELSFTWMVIGGNVQLPAVFNGNLSFHDSIIEEGLQLPRELNGTLTIHNSSIKGSLVFPKSGDYEVVLDDDTEMSKIIMPDYPKIKFTERLSNPEEKM